MTRLRLSTSAAALVLATTVLSPATSATGSSSEAASHAGVAPNAAAAHQGVASSTEVTLPTGDRVLLSTDAGGRQTVLVRPRTPTASGAATVISAAGDTFVVPQVAAGLIGRGLDLSMFDVTRLAADDGGSTSPLVLASSGPSYGKLPAGLTRTSPTRVAVTDPAKFGAALAASSAAAVLTGRTTALPSGLSLSLPGTRPAQPGLVTAPPKGKLYTVTVDGLNRSGAKDEGDLGVLTNADNTSRFIAGQSFYHGTFAFSVPRGHYSVQSYISTVRHGDVSYTLATVPQFTVSRDTTVTLDARRGTLFSAQTPRPSAAVHAELNLQRMPAVGEPFTDSLATFGDTTLYATPTKPVSVGKLYFYPAMRLGDADGSLTSYLYDLDFPSVGVVPAQLEYDVTADELATVHARYASVVPARTEEESRQGSMPWETVAVGSINDLVAPMHRLEYVMAKPHLVWSQEVDLDPTDGEGRTISPAAIYQGGQQATVDWNGQPMGSGVEQQQDVGQACPVCRSGDNLSVTVFPHVDSHNNLMLADSATTEQLTLFQDGTNVGESPSGFATFPLSADPASYRLQYDVDTSAAWFPTSTHVSTSWDFDSQERAPDHLPPGWTCGGKLARASTCSFEHLLLPHYVTSAGLDGVVPAGTIAHVGVSVTPQRGLPGDPLTSMTARVSYDGGKTWRAVTATKQSDTSYRLTYQQPKLAQTDGFASLRITAVAASGSKVSQTTLHAYPLAAPTAPPSTSSPAPPGQPGCAAAALPPLTQCLGVVNPADVNRTKPVGYGPADLRRAYRLPAGRTSTSTVAVVTPYDDLNAESDLATYRSQFGLPACTADSGCLTKVNEHGQASPLPPGSPDWSLQTSLALDAISATCPTCKILLVEADTSSLTDLVPAALSAARLHADVISNGYGTTGEFSGEQTYEHSYRTLGVPFVAASDDYGYGNGAPLIGSVSYPSASRFAIAVGGTTLTKAGNSRGFTETAWAQTTSGCSAYITKPVWQVDRLCSKRTTADVAAVADPATGLAVYDTYGSGGWQEVGGTAVAAAVVAGVFGLHGGSGSEPAGARLYGAGARLFDITEGANGVCHHTYICTAVPGYDGPSGVGTPNGVSAF